MKQIWVIRKCLQCKNNFHVYYGGEHRTARRRKRFCSPRCREIHRRKRINQLIETEWQEFKKTVYQAIKENQE